MEGREVVAVTGYPVPGLDFYKSMRVGVADLDESSLVAVERSSGDLVEGRALFLRIHAVVTDPAKLSRAALGTLWQHASYRPMQPGGHRPSIFPEQEFAQIRAPRVESGTLIFWSTEGEMSPELVERHVNLTTGETSLREPDH